MTLEGRLAKRFRNVAGVTTQDLADWIEEAVAESGYAAGGTGEDNKDNALLYLAYSIGCFVIATDAARYFKYTDADEAVDKTMVGDKYLALAEWGRKQYAIQLRGGFGASQSHPARFDGR